MTRGTLTNKTTKQTLTGEIGNEAGLEFWFKIDGASQHWFSLRDWTFEADKPTLPTENQGLLLLRKGYLPMVGHGKGKWYQVTWGVNAFSIREVVDGKAQRLFEEGNYGVKLIDSSTGEEFKA